MQHSMEHDSITDMLSKPVIVLIVLTLGLILLANVVA